MILPVSHEEISTILVPLLHRCDAGGRKHIAGLAVAAALETYPPEERYQALDKIMQEFRVLLPHLWR
jgi:hypothetical protein